AIKSDHNRSHFYIYFNWLLLKILYMRLLGHKNKQLVKISTIYSLATQGTIKIVLGAAQLIDT
uniref:hypothetical protein n=1 Tax=Aeromonas sp. QDB05 TaxID=2990478 RepID=UPI0022E8C8E7